jgi:SAM-dependent methyltransferase
VSGTSGDASYDASPDAASYDAIPDYGALYDSVPAYVARPDVDFWVAEAARAGGPVLELGCGTGRVLLPVARAGVAVAGLDASDEMLGRCRAKLAAEDEATRARVTLHRGDVRDFALGTTFAAVIAPFRIVQHLVTIDDQLRCLACVARHLPPGGRFVFDVFNPNYAAMASDRSAEAEDSSAVLPDGRTMRRTIRIPRVRWTDQVTEAELIYYVESPGAAPVRHVHAFEMRWYVPAELVHLLARAGFAVRATYGDYARSPLTDDAPELIVCAERLPDR